MISGRHLPLQTEYKDFVANRAQQKSVDAKLYRSILEKGESWSENFSDEELRERLHGVSVLQENDRRLKIASKPNRYMVNLDYGVHLTNDQTSDDPATQRDNRYTVGGLFEFVPFLHHETLERFSIEGGVRMDRNAFENNGTNLPYNETSLSLGANWYPLYASYVISTSLFSGRILANRIR